MQIKQHKDRLRLYWLLLVTLFLLNLNKAILERGQGVSLTTRYVVCMCVCKALKKQHSLSKPISFLRLSLVKCDVFSVYRKHLASKTNDVLRLGVNRKGKQEEAKRDYYASGGKRPTVN